MPGRRVAVDAAAELTRQLVEKCGARPPMGGAATPDLTAQILAQCGEHATDSAYERGFYRRDVAPLPGAVDRIFRTLPDLVVRPRATEEVAAVVALARHAGAAVTVRAGASTSHAGCVPVRGGVVLDMSALKGVVGLDLATRTARVRSGTVWTEFERTLAEQGLAPMAVPSSAPASTVGGWLCTMGHGIGSLKYGPLIEQVRWLEVVFADGSVRRLTRDTHPPLEWFADSEGTLGVVTEVELAVRRASDMRHALVACPSMHAVCELASLLTARAPLPYAIDFDDRHALGALDALGFAPFGWQGSELLRVDWEGPQPELEAAEAVVNEAVATVAGTRRLPTEVADGEWRERFRMLRVKRGGPSVLGAELLLPLSGLEGYARDVGALAHRQGTRLMTYGHLASACEAVVMTMYYADETRLVDYLLDLSLVKKLHDIGAAHGGAPYGLGLWNTPHVRMRLTRLSPSESRRRKRELDATGIMNPGKGVARLALMNPAAVRLGMETLAVLRRASRAVRR